MRADDVITEFVPPPERPFLETPVPRSRWIVASVVAVAFSLIAWTLTPTPTTQRIDTAVSSGNLVMVTGNGGYNLNSDSEKRTLFEAFGWTVTAIDDNSSAGAFAAAAAANDVMYLSDSTSNAGDDVRDLDIGLLVEDHNSFNEVLYSSSSSIPWSVDVAMDIVDTGHYITSGLSLGNLTIYGTSDYVSYWNAGSIALPSGVEVLADSISNTNYAALMVAETGAALLSSQTAANRRVWVPTDLTDASSFNSTYESLLERSLEWAAGFDATPTVTVNSTGDGVDSNIGDNICSTGGTNSSGATECTLRAAIAEANASSIVNTIEFAMPTGEAGYTGAWWNIAVGTSELPEIIDDVTIDGSTQTGYSSSPLVVIDGSTITSPTDGDGIRVTSGAVTLRALSVVDAPGDGIDHGGTGSIEDSYAGLLPDGTADGNGEDGIRVTGSSMTLSGNTSSANNTGIRVAADTTTLVSNKIGTNPAGDAARGNLTVGLRIESGTPLTIGGIGVGNVISANGRDGIWFTGGSSIVVEGNNIGVAADGTTPMANGSASNYEAIDLTGATGTVRIGGTAAGAGNTLYGSGDGVRVTGSVTATILGNSISNSTGLGIDLNDDGVTANDAGDGDSGPNDLLNFPVITDSDEAAGTVSVDYQLDAPAGNYRIEFFENPSGAGTGGYGEGQNFVHGVTVTHGGTGVESFSTSYSGAGSVPLTATATQDLGGGSYGATSEFSLAITTCSDGDGDGLCSHLEALLGDTDGDATANSADSDDDNDTTLTGSESADPNGDGDPRDALDSDRDGQPDYLDRPSDSTTGLAVGEQKISETTGGGPDLDGDDRFGRGVAAIGDIDGDGIVDAAIGASDGDDGGTDRGEVHVLLLNADGTVKTSQKISDTDGGLARSLADGDEFGRSVAGLGDLDGDAIPDLAVGTPGIDDGGTDRGAVHILFLNSDGTVKAETTISQSGGGGPGLGNSDGFGTSVAGLGDLNGDGLPDLAVGIAGDDDGGAQRGAAMVLFLNADGSAASTQKISSTTGGLTGTLDDGDGFGTAVAGPGDVDGDGVADLVVGATADDDGGPNRGAVYVLLLNTDGTVRAEQKISSTAGGFTGPLVDGDLFGVGVAGVGDLDRDGVPDLAVGAHTDDGGSDRGAVHLLFLNPDGSVGDEQRISDTGGGLAASLVDGDRFGSAIGSLGDLDGDGTPSLLIGADGDNDGASGTGAAYVLELNGGCSLGTGYGSTCPFASLDAVPVTADGRFWFDFGNGPFEASVDSDEGGRWLLVLQYHHLGGTNPALDVRSTTDDWPRYAPPVLGVDRSPTEWWGHTGQAAAAAIPDAATDLELRWAASTANHSRVIHFRSPVLGEFQTDAADDFNTGGLNTNFTALTGHTANVPAGLSNGYSNQGDLALTAFPFFATGAYHWGVRGNGDRWEVDDYVGGFGQNTVHQVWVRNGRIPAVVNSSGDGADANPGDSVCDTGGTNSDGETECTLRAVIEEANAAVLIDTIHFDIPTSDGGHSSGVWTIRPSSALPTISTAITVDGSTQPGWSADPVIALRADLAGSVALTVSAADSAIRSLVIHDQTGTGISLTGADRTVVAGSWIGLDPAGAADGGTVGVAVVGGTDVVIGGTTAVDRNVISGNGTDGVQVSGSPSGVTVRGNFIGTAADGTTNRGNGGSGVAITGGSDTAIGGADAGAGNTIAYNTDGVSITGSNDNPILGNSIHSNTGDGLDLGTANDNLTVPSPISAVVSGLVTDTIIDLDLPAGDYRLEFFANPSGVDPGGGEGETFRGAATITHTGSGVERFTPRVTGIAVDDVLTVTATEDAGGGNYGSTTEFSTSITAEAIVLPVLERIQSGTTTLADGASIATANITAVEPTKAFTTFTIRGDDGDPNDFTVSGTLSDATTMTFQRSGTGGDMVIEWSVVEFASGVAVQRGSVSPTGSIENVTLTSVEPTRSFVLLSHHNNGSQFGADDFVAGWLSSDTNLVVSSLNATDAVTWQVVTYDGAIVRRGTTAMTSGEATVSPSVETVDPARSWLVYSMTSSAGTVSNIGQKMVRGRIVDGSTLSFDRDNSGQALDLYWEVIEFPEGVEVQHASVAFGSSASVVDVTIDEVFRGRSIAVGGRNLVGGRTPYAADDNPGVATFTTELTSGTNLRVRRDAASGTAELGWFVLHWPCDDTDGDGLCDDAEDHNTDADDNPSTNPGPDTDGDGNADYLDADDDGDTIPTAAENPDPNGDGDPRDAADADRDRQPDYLDAPTTAARGRVGGEQKISDVVGGFGASLTDDAGFGGAAAPIGDLDGDGIVDVVVGSAGDDDGGSDRGAVHVLFLNANGAVKAEQKISDTVGGLTETLGDGDRFGSSVTGLGDLDGDGIPDIVVGAPGEDDGGTDSGAVYVLLLNANGTVKAEQNISTGSGGLTVDIAQDEFGASVAGPGDLNDDGLPDVVIGAPANDDGGADAGAAVVIFLNPDGTVQSDRRLSQSSGGLLAGLGAGNRFGAAATSLGDLDGGGTPDVAIGAPADGTGGTARGAAWVLQLDAAGAVTGGTKLADGTGGFLALLDDQDQLGAAVLGLGDIDHDGVPDLAVGADRDDDGGTDRGAIHVLLLNTDGSVRSQSKISSIGGALTGPLADGDRFGAAGAGIGDLNGDGRIDVIVGATGDDDGGSGRGAVYVLNLDAAADQDGDGLYDYVEDADTDADRDPSTNPGPNTDGDGLVNYLDADDDNDGVATASENADPNGDGEPTDARDGDRDGQPDYLDPATGRSLVRIAAEQKISDTGGGFSTALEDGDGFGAAAAAIGDLDGDGVVDAVVGVAGDDDGGTGRGAVFVLFLNADGSVKGEQKISDTTGGLVATLADGGGFGTAVAGLGDLDDDGINEVAVGAPDTGTGTVFVLFLNTDGTVRAEQTIGSGAGGLVAALDSNDRFGASVAAVDDVDGDGILDLAVGASGDGDGGSGHGAVHLLFLKADGSVKGERKISDTTGNLSHTFGTGEAFGASAAGLGDLDGDGTPDLLVGATGNDDGGTDRGALLALFLNADGSVKGEQRISDTNGGLPFGLADGANFGGAVSLVGDLDLDGVRDIAVGIVTDGDGGGGAGAVQVLHLNTNGTVKSGRKISATSGGLTGP
ncbi:MAG: right-handed parallel beta-helix repeat-containing protein, partial [Actinomycetota bacterium]